MTGTSTSVKHKKPKQTLDQMKLQSVLAGKVKSKIKILERESKRFGA